jgi:hypothetical protein
MIFSNFSSEADNVMIETDIVDYIFYEPRSVPVI